MPKDKWKNSTLKKQMDQKKAKEIQSFNNQKKAVNYSKGIIRFGKHKGQMICRLPTSYLEWLVEQEFVNQYDKTLAYSALSKRTDRDFGPEPYE